MEVHALHQTGGGGDFLQKAGRMGGLLRSARESSLYQSVFLSNLTAKSVRKTEEEGDFRQTVSESKGEQTSYDSMARNVLYGLECFRISQNKKSPARDRRDSRRHRAFLLLFSPLPADRKRRARPARQTGRIPCGKSYLLGSTGVAAGAAAGAAGATACGCTG